ncbi:MAG: rod shape-determining protein MreD [Candidatus Limnocylindrales bacterium]
MTLLLAAVGSVVAALVELSVGPHIRIGGAQPHFVLVMAVVLTIAVGLEPGLVWAFVGGIALDILAQRPLGSTSFALLVCVGGTTVLARSIPHIRPVLPIAAVFIFSLGYSMILFSLQGALAAPLPIGDPLGSVIPGTLYDVVLAALVGPLSIAVHDRRRAEQERVAW